MAIRLDLHRELSIALGSGNVYYQPPESVKLKYPCIVYSKDRDRVERADNRHYVVHPQWNLILIEHDPDSDLADGIVDHFNQYCCSIDRRYRADNLYHTAITLYY